MPNGTEARFERRALLGTRRRILIHGRAAKADLWVAEVAGREVVVKEFRDRRSPARAWGQLQIAREARMLKLLEGLPQVPRLIGRLDTSGLVMEHVEGAPLFEILDEDLRRRGIAALSAALGAVHARGIVHMDLRSRENAQVTREGSVTLLDWASAIHLRPGSASHRVLFKALRIVDRSAVVKWKELFAPDTLSDEDEVFRRRFLALRRLWPVNRKGVGRVDRRPPAHRTK